MCLDISFGHPYQSVYVPVLAQHLTNAQANAVVPPVVKQSVSIALSGDAGLADVESWAGEKCAMISTTAVNVPAVSPLLFVTCKLCKDTEQNTISYSYVTVIHVYCTM